MTFERIDQPAPDAAYREALTACVAIGRAPWRETTRVNALARTLYSLPLDAPRAKLMTAVFNAPKGTFGALVASRIASL